MAKKQKAATFDQSVEWFRGHGFETADAPGTANRIFLKKHNCSAAIEKAADGRARIFAYPGCLMGGEIAKLVNRGYQQFLKTAKAEAPATADKLRALHDFAEEFKEGLRLPSLYNESLGTTSEDYLYDRIPHRDQPRNQRPSRPWERASDKPA